MLNVDTPNPAHATIEKLLSPAVDVLLRPPRGWKRPDDLLGALAEKIATNKGERGAWEEPRIADPEKAEVIGTLNAALKSAANAWLQTKPSPDDEDASAATPRATPPSKRCRTCSRIASERGYANYKSTLSHCSESAGASSPSSPSSSPRAAAGAAAGGAAAAGAAGVHR